MSKILIAALAGLMLMFVHAFGGVVEGRLFPVTSNPEISKIEDQGEGWTRVWGVAERLRGCSFHRLEWRLGNDDAFAVVDLVFEEGSKVRGDGTFSFGPWLLHLTPDQMQTRSYAIVFHRCHPFWLTQTRFYR